MRTSKVNFWSISMSMKLSEISHMNTHSTYRITEEIIVDEDGREREKKKRTTTIIRRRRTSNEK